MNSTFTNHEELDINSGVLIAIPKPGKPKGPPNNFRPITLLKTLRKVLSLITLDRIKPSIEKYLSHISTRINNADINAPFTSNVGTPQGDGLSPVLFTIYLEHALKEVRTVIGEPNSQLEEKIPREIAFADDVDFVGLEYIDIDAVQRTLHRYNLKVNINKTEKKTSLSKNEDAWRSTKKVADG